MASIVTEQQPTAALPFLFASCDAGHGAARGVVLK